MSDKALTYAASGVDYGAMDPFKRLCQRAGLNTSRYLELQGFEPLDWSRGESVYLAKCMWADFIIGHVEEGLGTLNKVAEAADRLAVVQAIWRQTGLNGFVTAGHSNAAMALNDVITLGPRALTYSFHLAVGDKTWFDDVDRAAAVIEGIESACHTATCTWGGGETPTLVGIVLPGTALLSGSATGIIRPLSRLINPANIQAGDAIVLFDSSGMHANGYTAARLLAELVGYGARMEDGRTFAEGLLDPTMLYGPMIAQAQDAGIDFHYLMNITGHGWRKIMRAFEPWVYVMNWVPEVQAVFRALQAWGGMSDYEAYGNYNMGAGFAAILSPEDAKKLCAMFTSCHVAGYVEKRGLEKKVIIEPKGLTYEADTLAVR